MKKIVKIFAIILVLIIVILGVRRIYYNAVGINPDELYLSKENSEESIKANLGSYQWSDKGLHVVADAIEPTEIDFAKSFDVKQNEKLYFTDSNWTKASAIILLESESGKVTHLVMDCNVEENYIVVPIITGEYIVQINLESSKGNVWYAVKLNIFE